MEQKMELKLEQILTQQQLVETEELDALKGKTILFQTISSQSVVYGTLKSLGNDFLFLDNPKLLNSGTSIEGYVNGNYPIVKQNIKAEAKSGAYNRRDISQLYQFDG